MQALFKNGQKADLCNYYCDLKHVYCGIFVVVWIFLSVVVKGSGVEV